MESGADMRLWNQYTVDKITSDIKDREESRYIMYDFIMVRKIPLQKKDFQNFQTTRKSGHLCTLEQNLGGGEKRKKIIHFFLT